MRIRLTSDGNARGKQLVDALLDGTATEADILELDALLQADAELRRYYCSASELEAHLRWMHRAQEPAEIVHQIAPVDRSSHRASPRAIARPSRVRPLLSAAAILFLVGAVGVVLGLRGQGVGNEPQAGGAEVVANVISSRDCVWSGTSSPPKAGSGLPANKWLTLERGIARLEFRGGATVLVESPARFEPISGNSLRLAHGNVAVRASGPVKDFVVLSPDASIVDLGTCFAVHCDEGGATEVEVLEGAVKLVPGHDPRRERVLEMGASVQVDTGGKRVSPIARLPDDDRFTNLIEQLWGDIRVPQEGATSAEGKGDHTVEANFADTMPGMTDTFYAAKRGDGWLTPWVASGNPQGRILRNDPSFGIDNPYLRVRFNGAYERAIAREYGSRPGFDPSRPHVISWKWRLDGKSSRIDRHFFDRVTFYGNPFFRRSSWPTNSWLIGVVGGDEEVGASAQASTEFLKSKHRGSGQNNNSADGPRRVHAQRWYFFDNQRGGIGGAVFDRRNMIDTGMKIKPNVLYHFAVAVYPAEARYDAAIRDDEQTVVRTGLSFRSRENVPANVIHFTTHATRPQNKQSFSLDSVRIEPLHKRSLEEQLNAGKSPPPENAPSQKEGA